MISKNTIRSLLLFLTLFITILWIGSTFVQYKDNVLDGRLEHHLLISNLFGIPADLSARGVEALYEAPDTGWDGQFHYFMSNDIFAEKDTPYHIDNPGYRYSRIGISATIKLLSLICGQDYVSPHFYFYAYVLICLLAVILGFYLLERLHGKGPLILFWSLSAGGVVTLYNGLPDAAADSFFIFTLFSLCIFYKSNKDIWLWLAISCLSISILTREIYLLFALSIVLVLAYEEFIDKKKLKLQSFLSLLPWLIPIFVFLGWKYYVYTKFGPIDSGAVMGLPFVAIFECWSLSKANQILIPLFLLVLSLGITSGWLAFRRGENVFIKSIGLFTVGVSLLYCNFGYTVMFHWTGYLKALGPIILSLLILARLNTVSQSVLLLGGLFSLLLLSNTVFLKERILTVQPPKNLRIAYQTLPERFGVQCLERYNYTLEVISERLAKVSSRFSILQVELKNNTKESWSSHKGDSSVFLSYHWLDRDGRVVVDGVRTPLPKEVHPGEVVPITLYIKLPFNYRDLYLAISPVQEGCAWFYLVEPTQYKYRVDFNGNLHELN